MRRLAIIASSILLMIPVATSVHSEEEQKVRSFSPYVDEKGGISLPTDFRDKWTFLGVWVLHEAKGMMHEGIHDVFTQPGVVEAYKKNDNIFPDGAVLVKEVRSAKSAAMTSSPDVVYADEEILWFVMIKDDKNRYPNNPNWGEGWGWALFKVDDPSKNVSTDFKKDCIPCHIPAKQTDWVYIKGYPSLHN